MKKSRIALVGLKEETDRVVDILKQTISEFELVGLVHPDNSADDKYIGNMSQLEEIVRVNKVDELIFCSNDMSAQNIIREMLRLEGQQVSYKIAPPESLSIIGSNSIDTAGELYVVDFNNITKPRNIRIKRLFDVVISIIALLLIPVLVFIIPHPFSFIRNIFQVLFGIKTWVGFLYRSDVNTFNLPKLKTGITSLALSKKKHNGTVEQIEKANLLYAKDFSITSELAIIFSTFKSLGK